jgi:hypothetical protein
MKRIHSIHLRAAVSSGVLTLLGFIVTGFPSSAQPLPAGYSLTQPQPGVAIIKSDADSQGTLFNMKTTHQNAANLWAEKTLHVPQQALQGKTQARVRALMSLLDTSPGTEKVRLRESFELLVSGASATHLAKAASGWEVTLNRSIPNATLQLCAADGEAISEQTAGGTKVLLQAPKSGQPVYVKLLRGRHLVDATALP